VHTSGSYAEKYRLYRLLAFERERCLFVLPGPLRINFALDPTEYEATL
jgi:hypothetical protein